MLLKLIEHIGWMIVCTESHTMIFIGVTKTEESVWQDPRLLQVMHLGIGSGKVVKHPATLDICMRASFFNLDNWNYFNTFANKRPK